MSTLFYRYKAPHLYAALLVKVELSSEYSLPEPADMTPPLSVVYQFWNTLSFVLKVAELRYIGGGPVNVSELLVTRV